MPTQDPNAPLEPQTMQGLPFHQQVVAIVLAVAILLVVIELVRKRKLREEYSILWIVTAVALLALAVEHQLLTWFQNAIGAVLPISALFFGALVFLVLVSLQYSVRLSKLTARNKTLCQKIALLERDVEQLKQQRTPASLGDLERPRKRKTEAS